MSTQSRADKLRELLERPGCRTLPGVYDAMSAMLVERAGFEAAFMTGFGVSAARIGLPDTGLISYAEMVDQGRNMAAVTSIPIIARAQPALLASGTFFLAEREGEVVGAGGWSQAAPGGVRQGRRRLAHVRHVVTDHRATRRGIGRALLGHVMMDAQEAGMAEMRCQSTLTAVPFYRAMGFSEVGPITVELPRGIGFPAMLMRRLL